MSDLFCAATLLLAGEAEGAAVARLLSSLRDRKVAGVYAAESAAAVRTAEAVAAETGLPVHTVAGLVDAEADETGDDVVRRVAGEFEAIADLYRGETVLVVANPDLFADVLPRLAGTVTADDARSRPLEPGQVGEVAIDADGVVVRAWGKPSSTSPGT